MRCTTAILVIATLGFPFAVPAEEGIPAFQARGTFTIRGFQDREDIVPRKRAEARAVELGVACTAVGPSPAPPTTRQTRYVAAAGDLRTFSSDGLPALRDYRVLLTTPPDPLASIRSTHDQLTDGFRTRARERMGAALREVVDVVNAGCTAGISCTGGDVLDTVRSRMERANRGVRTLASRLRIRSSAAYDGLDVRETTALRLSLRELAYRLSLRMQSKNVRTLSEMRARWLDDQDLVPAFSIAAVGAADFYARVKARADQQWFRAALAIEPVLSKTTGAEVSVQARGRVRARFHECVVTVLFAP